MSEVVSLDRHDIIAIVTVNNPPVNALSAAVRGGILETVRRAVADPEVKAIVLTCAGRTFIAGADITEFGKPPKPPGLHEVLVEIENSPKPVVAAIHGTALGGGLEVALACHFRVATGDARLGLPEVKLGLLPGAGGTQRLPRAVGPELAVRMIVSGEPISASEALNGLIEEIVALVERSPDSARPVPAGGPPLRWPPAGVEFEARAQRGGSLARRRAGVLAHTLFAFLIMRSGIKVGGFVPKTYTRQVVENSDFRKFDDGLRMILDCSGELESRIAERLARAASEGVARYGLHRQDAAMMTCFTPSVLRSDHVHFIDGARGGYASAATALKAAFA